MSASLFSVFEPSAFLGLSLNWVSLLCFLILPTGMVATPAAVLQSVKSIAQSCSLNTREVLGLSVFPGAGALLSALMIWVMLNNFLGLGPYFFTTSAHLVFGFSLGLSVWLGYMTIYVIYFNEEFLSHLIPGGTPTPLVVLMIVIEAISSLIRPLTLMFRLTANMIAGHLLVTLLSNAGLGPHWGVYALVAVALVALLVLESAVALIQSYVFYLLSSLYISDLTTQTSAFTQAKAQVL